MATSTPRAASSLRGVVIGIDHYRHFGDHGQLTGCVNDAVAIHHFLVDHVGVPAARLELLLAPAPDRREPVAATGPATAADLRAAFARLAVADDAAEVIVFYAGHGIRIARASTGEYVYGLAPADAAAGADGFANLVLGHELSQLVQRLLARGVTPTVIADTCHAGGSLRATRVDRQRRLVPPDGGEWRAGEEAWRALAASASTSEGRRAGSGWLDEVTGNDWVMLAACRDTETAGEYDRETVTGQRVSSAPHGKLTGTLLAELERVPAGAIAGLRWIDLYPGVRRAMAALGSQTPTLEGRPERPVFGGAWRPFQPGFTVEPTGRPDVVAVGAGQLHGLEPGAQLAIFAPGTADLAVAAPSAHAVVEQATTAASTAQVTAGGPVAPASRARLTRPGPRTPAIRVVIASDEHPPLGAATIEALAAAAGAAGSVVRVDRGPADVELRHVAGRWAMVPFSATDPTVDDVIAYLPEVAAGVAAQGAAGRAIAAGLAHWAAYLRLRDRTSLDPTLRGLIEIHLRVGAGSAATPESCPRQRPDATGTYDAVERDPLWIELATQRVPTSRVFVAVVLCSDDGNAMVLWPPPGGDGALGAHGAAEHGLPAGQTLFIGRDRYSPAFPTVRPDQERSRYTLKVVACTVAGRAPDLSGLALERTVQEVIDASLGARDIEVIRPVAPDLWCTWDLPVRVARRR